MSAISFLEKRFAPFFRALAGRARAWWVRCRGGTLGVKTRIGARGHFLRPWNFRCGERVEIESDVFVKIVSDEARLTLGDHVFVGRGVEFDVMERVDIGSHVLIAPGVFITDHNHRYDAAQRIDEQGCESRKVRIGDDVWIGAYCVILPGVTISRGALIAANSVVNCDVDEMCIFGGSPARLIGRRT
jgi:acetyltransferase-like isoleucine patch superfamily enzyme